MFRSLSAIALFTILLFAFPVRAGEYPEHFTPAVQPAALPDFLFEDDHGQSVRLADYKGHAIVLNLWATWCPPCVEELPSLDRLQAQFPDRDLMVITLDQERNSSASATNFFKRHEIKNLLIYNDTSGRTSSILRARFLPASFLIDTKGMTIGFVLGAVDWSSPEMVAFIKSHLFVK